jgi:hypothetical protein
MRSCQAVQCGDGETYVRFLPSIAFSVLFPPTHSLAKKCEFFHQLHHEASTRHFLVLLPCGASMALKLPESDVVQLQSVLDKIAVLRPEYRRMDLCLKFENGQPLDDKVIFFGFCLFCVFVLCLF